MASTTKKVLHKRSVAVENELPKLPTSSQLEYGELAINYADGYETISIKNNNNEIVTFSNDNSIDKKINKVIPYVVTIETGTTARLTANCPELDSLEEGQSIILHLTSGTTTGSTGGLSSSCALNLTLSNGTTTGFKILYYGGTTKVTTHYAGGNDIRLTYHENLTIGSTTGLTGWWVEGNYDSNTVPYYLYYYGVIKSNNAFAQYALAMQTSAGTWNSVVTTSSTATTKTPATNGFVLGSDIIYYSYTLAAQTTGSASYGYIAHYAIDFRYSSNAGSTLTIGLPVYFVGTVNDDGLFYLDGTTWWTQTLPTQEDGKVYINLGTAYSTYSLTLYPSHTIYEFKNGHIRQYQEDNTPEIVTEKSVFSGLTQSGSIVDAYLVKEVIRENELVTSTALNDLNTRANNLTTSAQSIDTRVTALENKEVDLSTVASAVTVNGTTYAVSNGGVNIGSYLSASTVYISGITLNGSAVPVTNKVANLGNVVTAITINESAMTPTNGTVNLGNYIPIEKELTISSAFNDLNDRITELEGLVQSLSTQLQSLQNTVNNMNNSGGSAA